MVDWSEKINKAQKDEEERKKRQLANEFEKNRQIRLFVEKEVYPAFDEIQKKYKGMKFGYHVFKNVVNPSLYNGNKENDNYDWRYEISFISNNEGIYVQYEFQKLPGGMIKGEFESAHISLLKMDEIITKFADLMIQY